jgi:chloramphenicol-sensitive protein RarD
MANKSVKAGVLFALAAYFIWGIAPIYFKLLVDIPALEIVVHRIIWSVVVLILLVVASGQMLKVRVAIRDYKILIILLISGLLLAINWLVFIWAVNNDRLLDASLGYYINPLVNIFLGRVFLSERFRVLQQLSVVLAVVGVAILVLGYGQVPWVSLVLASSFGVYGLLRKQVGVDSLPGLLIETAMMLPFAIIYWIWFAGPVSNLFTNTFDINFLLLFLGIMTTVPLLCFTAAARRIQYSTLGFFQYIGPSLMFLLAVFIYQEPLSVNRLMTFAFVWGGLLLFSFDSYLFYKKNQYS